MYFVLKMVQMTLWNIQYLYNEIYLHYEERHQCLYYCKNIFAFYCTVLKVKCWLGMLEKVRITTKIFFLRFFSKYKALPKNNYGYKKIYINLMIWN